MILIREDGRQTSSLIHGLGDGFDVRGVYTKSHATQMIGLESFRPLSYSFFPDSAMSNALLSLEVNLSVPPLTDCGSLPDPTWSGEATIFDSEVAFVNESGSPMSAKRHTQASYQHEEP